MAKGQRLRRIRAQAAFSKKVARRIRKNQKAGRYDYVPLKTEPAEESR